MEERELSNNEEVVPNLNKGILDNIMASLGLKFCSQGNKRAGMFDPYDILDYIYAVLNSKQYRINFNGMLKVDFPRVPYPKERVNFWRLVELGSMLRQGHLLHSLPNSNNAANYPIGGSNEVISKFTKSSPGFVKTADQLGKVWINDEQYFDNVPLKAWEFYIGGFQPAQKWLKDRRGRELRYDDIQHYQKIIAALMETDRIMKEIDEVIEI